MPKESTKEQLNNLIEFRQAVYEQGLTRAGDVQFELVDALLLSPFLPYAIGKVKPSWQKSNAVMRVPAG